VSAAATPAIEMPQSATIHRAGLSVPRCDSMPRTMEAESALLMKNSEIRTITIDEVKVGEGELRQQGEQGTLGARLGQRLTELA
jgi:hypothetical protein